MWITVRVLRRSNAVGVFCFICKLLCMCELLYLIQELILFVTYISWLALSVVVCKLEKNLQFVQEIDLLCHLTLILPCYY